ncbi:unnamed protein product [Lathyrus oleraceus]
MASMRYLLIWVILFLCVLSFSTKPSARNIPNVSKLNSDLYEMSMKRLLGQGNRRPKCKRGRFTYAVSVSRLRQDQPRCHNY